MTLPIAAYSSRCSKPTWPSVEEALAYHYTDAERASVARNRSRLFVGTPATILSKLQPMIAAMTISFGIGQTLGPIVVGAITDAMGSLSFALNVSAAMLALGAVLSAFQRKVRQNASP